MRAVARKLRAREIESVAICLINAHMNPAHERRAREILLQELPGLHVSLSTDILPEPPEFERTATTVANAYCAPVLRRYMDTLEEATRRGRLRQRHRARHAQRRRHDDDRLRQGRARQDAQLGPGGRRDRGGGRRGLGGPARTSSCLDMGGTSADIAVVRDGEPQLTTLVRPRVGHADPLPEHRRRSRSAPAAARSPGSTRPAIRAAGRRARAPIPGPACYGKGGTEPTNTDAQLVLGRVSNDLFLDGRMQLDVERLGRGAAAPIAEPLGLSVEDAAEGVLRIANANMVKAIRLVTVERGFDPREFGLVAFGGAGPLHAVDLARELQMPEVIVPPVPRRDERDRAALRRSARRLLLGVRAPRRTRSTWPSSGSSTRRWTSASVGNLVRQGVEPRRDRRRALDRPPLRRPAALGDGAVCRRSARAASPAAVAELPRRAPAPVPLLAPRARRSRPRRCGSRRAARARSPT